MIAALRRLAHRASLDRTVLYGALSSVRAIMLGPVTALLIVAFFTPEQQGYYYAFGSLLALQIFVDLGLGQVVIQFASHEWAHLRRVEGRVEGAPQAQARLSSLARLALRWYAVGALALVVGLGAAGLLFFGARHDEGVDWRGAWLAMCALTGVRLALSPWWSLLEGCHEVRDVYAYRLTEGVLSSLAIWLGIILGFGLWAAVVGAAVGVGSGLVWLAIRHGRFLTSIIQRTPGAVLTWAEIWPLQWRIASSWAMGYLVFSLFVPIAFYYHGPIVAGQLGLTLAVVHSLSAVAGTWIFSRAPIFGSLIAKREFGALDVLALRVGAAALGVAVLGAVAILAGLEVLTLVAPAYAARVLPVLPTSLFLLATVLNQISFAQSTYLRAHKREPFLLLSLAGGGLTGLSTWLLGAAWGPVGMAAGYLAVIALIGLPIGTLIVRNCRRRWHAASSGSGTDVLGGSV